MTNEHKLDVARKMIFEVWDSIVPDYPVEDNYYDQVETTAVRLIDDLQQMQTYVECAVDMPSPKWNPDLG
ncbi:MAG: hypothetical protein KIT61_00390 [Pyrinomonadaceae bacterium]|jgi:hypothetical protein|nr:hypothetical protein [Blastocatellia bacterium]MCW5955009.1 hypothetical protein [Pyrinomonadaceae bacterium]